MKDAEHRALWRWSADNEMPRVWSGNKGLTYAYGHMNTGDQLEIEFRGRTGGIVAELRCIERPKDFPLRIREEHQCVIGPLLLAYVPSAEKMTELLVWFAANRKTHEMVKTP